MIKVSIFIFGLLLISCSANKYLPEGEKYFEGHEADYLDNTSQLPKSLKLSLMADLEPDATRRLFVSRPGTWLYSIIDEPKKQKGFKYFVKYKLGTKPVYLSYVNLDRNVSIVQSRLRSNGFFRANVVGEVDSTSTSATAIYKITLGIPYHIDSLDICQPQDSTGFDPQGICPDIQTAHDEEGVIEQGSLFRKSLLETERANIAKYFKDKGYYFFNQSFLYFKADSNDGSKMVDLKLLPKPYLPSAAVNKYRINSTTINLAAGSDNTETVGDTTKLIYDPDRLYLKWKKLEPFIELRPGELYNKTREEVTLKQLNRLEVFEFVNIQYKVDTTDGRYLLNAEILANPRSKQSLSAEFNVTTTSTSFTGPGIQGEYYNRNLFRGAEKLRVTATGRYEKQLSGSGRGLTAYELDFETNLLFPRIISPIGKTSSGNLPNTKYRVQYRLYSQPNYYAQSALSGSFGYEWLYNDAIFNDLRLLNIDYIKLLRTSERLQQLFDDDILSEESFADQVIIGPSYSVTYSPPVTPNAFFRFFVAGSAESSGNTLYGLNELFDFEKNANDKYTFFKVPFAQYLRFQVDLREYLQTSKYNQLVFRQNVGWGVPFLNSKELPFSKQFFVGGANSLRGFQPREVGPGTYTGQSDNSFFDQTGDILIELNVEDRFDLGGFFEGALFMDVGNVWLSNENAARPGGKFEWNKFGNQLAVATGIGLRVDLQFVIIRLDLAFPLRKPGNAEGNRWVADEISIAKDWRQENLLLNIAIGYPF